MTISNTLRVGRLTLPMVEVGSVASVTTAGDKVTVTGRIESTDAGELAIIRDALRGMIDDVDEPVVAVLFGAEPHLSGYYRVTDGSVTAGPGALAVGYWEFSLGLDSGGNRGSWLWTATVQGGMRTNSNGWTSNQPSPWFALPDGVRNWVWSDGNADTETTIATELGTVRKRRKYQTYNAVSSWVGDPATHYVGAALLEQRVPNSNVWLPVIGRRTTPAMHAAGWRLGNGITRVTYEAGAGNLLFECWRGGFGWEGRAFQIDGVATISGVTVLRNDPSNVVVECDVSGTGVGSRYVTFTARRGDTWVRAVARASVLTGWAIHQPSPGETWAMSSWWAQSAPATTGTLSRWLATSSFPFALNASGGITSTSTNLGSAWSFGISQTGIGVFGDFAAAQTDRIVAARR